MTNCLVSDEFVKSIFPDKEVSELDELRGRATRLVQEYLRTSFEVQQYRDEVLDLRKRVVPRHLPIVTVDEAMDPETQAPITDYTAYSDYVSFPNAEASPKGLVLTYTAGLEFDKLPEAFRLVAEDLIRLWAFKEGRLEELFYKKEDMEDRSYETRSLTEESILGRLASYRYFPYGTRRKYEIRIGVI